MNVIPRRGRQWTWAPAKPKVAPKGVKDEVTTMAHQLVEGELKPAYVQPPPKKPRWNYMSISSRSGEAATSTSSPDMRIPAKRNRTIFEVDFARLEYLSNGHFNVGYMRHTGNGGRCART